MLEKKPRARRKNSPKHTVTRRAYRFPLDTSAALSDKLFHIRDLCWEARNLLVAERTENRAANEILREAGRPTSYLTRADQYRRLSALVAADRRFAAVHSQVLQDVACRVDEGTKRWLETFKSGRRHVAPPSFIEKKDYTSFTFTQYGFAARLKNGRLHLSKIGEILVRAYRKMRGKVKTVTIKFEAGRWWAIFTCEIQVIDVQRSAAEVAHLSDTGADTGLASLLTTAHGDVFDPPKALKEALVKLRHEQRDMSRKFEMRKSLYETERVRRKAAGEPVHVPLREIPYSNRLKRQIKKVAKLHSTVRNIRKHHHNKIARRVERAYRLVAVEEHAVKFMLRNRKLARSAADRGVHALKQTMKAVLGPRYVPTANQRPGVGGNSQTCLCNTRVPKGLKDRTHDCPACGLIAPRDVVSANIAMKIAFGTTVLSSPEAELAFVRRGETKGGALCATAEPASASEVSVKRPSLASTSQTRPGVAEAAPEAKNTQYRRRKSPLQVAAQSVS